MTTVDNAARALAAMTLADKSLEAAEVAILAAPVQRNVDLEEAKFLVRMLRARIIRVREHLANASGPGV